ncbi:related to Tripeptidyl-peptidase I precursor [Claviceps purpurea 20.1]|uniref:tripeptidyl-peptidase II n=1 Tax=Claviceps purpurea (strain 20.1) TaxID=1111077 RepID=M1W8B8_CLAP2|nr:related to Tripeptidyl-peptidase I precursor [Claviceps purpurea 20.1]
MKNVLVFLTGLAATGLASPSDYHVLHEKRDANKPTSSDPGSPDYGKHYTTDQIINLFAPKQESIDVVKAWLVESGVPADSISLSKSRGWLMFNSSVSKLETLVKADYHVFENVHSRSEHIGTEEYSLPAKVAGLVDFVMPGTSLTENNEFTSEIGTSDVAKPIKKKIRVATTTEKFMPLSLAEKTDLSNKIHGTSACDKYITPQCIKAIYKIPDATSAFPNNSLGIFEALDDVYAQEDLDAFYKLTAPNIPAGTGPKLDLINGATAPNRPEMAGGESDLDFQMAIPIIYPQNTTLYQVKSQEDVFFALFDAIDGTFCRRDPDRVAHEMCDVFKPTNVISISYGGIEDDYTPKELSRQCNEFMKLGLLGVSVFVATGDVGVANQEGYCLGPHHDVFVSMNPVGCPFVTAVGSTTLPKRAKVGTPEIATTTFSSSGGFSNMFPQPPWQANAVGNYLLRHNPNYFAYDTTGNVIPNNTQGIYNRGGRAYPDISALGDNGVVVVGGEIGLLGGTSMSAPIVAGIFNRINDERMKLGKGPLGFVNPALYKAYDSKLDDPLFNDVVKGDQRLGGPYDLRYPSICGNNGFSAVEGWDPVTGLGTPKYPEMLKYFVNL